ncbi:hypothetical protein BHU72_01295 [Desulfuribacillus stibiiarsenatis]|uniref:Coat protein F n=1 Tax=Desulfuribacillus stibiiarsenatis TaxID=1390249 RepID=A0A1E5L9W4_9FIRM|nr:spore coat protein [Desulfuribacillus stibiiarsenatis]OEH86925.1 hypothetical protein BHU72_01295 [Desulfuribacillus stibiiarsenatis]
MQTASFTDRDLLNEMILLEKHASSLYHTATIEASSEKLHQDCGSIMQETLQCQRKLYNLMTQKGWYNTQNTDHQQISQSYQKFLGEMQNQFPSSQ